MCDGRPDPGGPTLTTEPPAWDWEQAYDRYWRLVASIARRLGLQKADGEDVQQQVWMAAFARFGEPPDPEVLKRFLAGTTVNVVRRLWRTRRRRPERDSLADADEFAAVGVLDPADVVARALREQALRECLEALDPKRRTLIDRTFLDPSTPSYDEISEELGMARGSIGPTRQRILAALRKCMEGKGYDT